MISLTKIDTSKIIINADEIETIDAHYNSTITLKSGKKIVVKESSDEIISKVVEYRQKCFAKFISPDTNIVTNYDS
jgi:flagellar protein FlbD